MHLAKSTATWSVERLSTWRADGERQWEKTVAVSRHLLQGIDAALAYAWPNSEASVWSTLGADAEELSAALSSGAETQEAARDGQTDSRADGAEDDSISELGSEPECPLLDDGGGGDADEINDT